MSGNVIETLVGAMVLVVAAVFVIFAVTTTDIGAVQGYELTAKFDRIDGLSVGADVRISGIKVGTVIDQDLDPVTFLAVVRVSIADSVQLPVDSSAGVVSDGLLGGKFMSVSPGGEDDVLGPGEEIRFTQASINIEQLLGKFMFSAGGDGS